MAELKGVRNVLFDLDGTLVDSSGTIEVSLQHALDRAGIGDGHGKVISSYIGMPLFDIFREGFGLGLEQTHAAIDDYRTHYDSLNQAGSCVYDGIPNVLTALSGGGYCLFIATVKPTEIAHKVLSDLDLIGHFDGVMGASMGPERRDKSSIIAYALSSFDLQASESMMVGDRDQDINGAQAHGLRSVGVTWGFGCRDEIEQAGPDHVVEQSGDITRLLLNAGSDQQCS